MFFYKSVNWSLKSLWKGFLQKTQNGINRKGFVLSMYGWFRGFRSHFCVPMLFKWMVVVIACLILVHPSPANRKVEVEALVNNVLSDLRNVARSGVSTAQRCIGIERVLDTHVDMPQIASTMIKERVWNQATEEEKRSFIEAFRTYFARRLDDNLEMFVGSSVTIKRIKRSRDQSMMAYCEVTTPPKSSKKNIGWKVSNQGDALKVVDLTVSGFSAVSHERRKVNRLFRQNNRDLSRLTSVLRGNNSESPESNDEEGSRAVN